MNNLLKAKWLVALMAFAIVFALVSCDEIVAPKGGASEIEYTDVVYSADGKTVTLYLDGIGVPFTESARAMTKDLAQMNYEFLEVVFIGGPQASQTIARTNWNIGERAGISGVYRSGTTATATSYGVDYSGYTIGTNTSAPAANADGIGLALMFVGMTDGTLMGIGSLTHVDNPTGAASGSQSTVLYSDSTSVTFTVTAIKTKLEPNDSGGVDHPTTTTDYAGNLFITSAGAAAPSADAASIANTTANWTSLGGVSYPIYSLPPGQAAINGTYSFRGDTGLAAGVAFPCSGGVVLAGNGVAQKRNARYQSGGRNRYAPIGLYTSIAVTMTNNQGLATTPDTFSPDVTLTFNTSAAGEGIFTFNIEIPVNALTATRATTDQTVAQTWYLRTGWDQFFYNLDSGTTAGGCVLMGVNITSVDLLAIYHIWASGS